VGGIIVKLRRNIVEFTVNSFFRLPLIFLGMAHLFSSFSTNLRICAHSKKYFINLRIKIRLLDPLKLLHRICQKPSFDYIIEIYIYL